jgi:hypothetical protein
MTDASDLTGLVYIIILVIAVFRNKRLQVVLNRVVPLLHCKMGQDAGRTLALAIAADGAVANIPTGRALPGGILESSSNAFPVPVAKTDTTELSTNSMTYPRTANGFHVQGFLPTLMATRALLL